MRALVALLVTTAAIGSVAAEPADPAKPKVPAKAKTKPAQAKAKAKAKAAPAPAAAPGVDLGSMARSAAGATDKRSGANDAATPNGARRLELSPSRLFGAGGVPKADRRGSEKGSGFSLGDDADWRVQAAQIGVMAVGFAALATLCGGGKCLLPDFMPDAVTDFLTTPEGLPPDLEIRQEPEVRPIR